MNNLSLTRYALSLCVTTLLLAGCGGTQVSPFGPLRQNAARPGVNAVQPMSIVYTPVNETLKDTGALELDLNNDKTNDFVFSQIVSKYYNNHYGEYCGFHLTLYLTPSQSSNGVVNGAHAGWAAALRAGRRIGSKRSFYQSYSLLADVSDVNERFRQFCFPGTWDYGYWWTSRTKYLALEFQIQGQTHYGWAQVVLSSGGDDDVFTTLTGYAYQTVAGKPIKAGQTK